MRPALLILLLDLVVEMASVSLLFRDEEAQLDNGRVQASVQGQLRASHAPELLTRLAEYTTPMETSLLPRVLSPPEHINISSQF